jgi:hypothetical protein
LNEQAHLILRAWLQRNTGGIAAEADLILSGVEMGCALARPLSE